LRRTTSGVGSEPPGGGLGVGVGDLAGCGAVGWLSVVQVWAGPGSGGAGDPGRPGRRRYRPGRLRGRAGRAPAGPSWARPRASSILSRSSWRQGRSRGKRPADQPAQRLTWTTSSSTPYASSAGRPYRRRQPHRGCSGPDTRPKSRRSASIRRRLRDMAGAETMDFVLECAVRRARPGGVVLLSSAAASMGMSATDGARGPAFEIAGRRWVGDRGGR